MLGFSYRYSTKTHTRMCLIELRKDIKRSINYYIYDTLFDGVPTTRYTVPKLTFLKVILYWQTKITLSQFSLGFGSVLVTVLLYHTSRTILFTYSYELVKIRCLRVWHRYINFKEGICFTWKKRFPGVSEWENVLIEFMS